MVKTDLRSKIDELEGRQKETSPLNNVDRFLGSIEHLRKSPDMALREDATWEAEYREVRVTLRPFPTNPPPPRRIPIVPEDGRLYEIAKGKRR
jgi:hypothetical protein